MIGQILAWLLIAIVAISAVLNIRKRGWRSYMLNVLIGVDQLGNALLGGMPDETISSRCGRGAGRYWYWRFLGRLLNWIQPGHIQMAMASEREHIHEPETLR